MCKDVTSHFRTTTCSLCKVYDIHMFKLKGYIYTSEIKHDTWSFMYTFFVWKLYGKLRLFYRNLIGWLV